MINFSMNKIVEKYISKTVDTNAAEWGKNTLEVLK